MSKQIREVYGETLVELGRENPDIIVLDADVSSSTCSARFAQAFPERFLNCGIAENNMVSMAAGLAKGGKTVFVNTFAAFISTIGLLGSRSLVAYSKANVKLMGAYGGLSDAYDGYTHHSIDDFAFMRLIPGMRVFVASDEKMTKEIVRYAASIDGPVYVRLSRDAMPDLPRISSLDMNKGSLLRKGNDVTIIACGAMCAPALEAAEKLAEENIQARVVDLFSLKPVDKQLICDCARETGAIVTAEEHSVLGGLGSIVAEVVTSCGCPVPVIPVGVQDTVTESGPYPQLLKKYGLDSSSIINAVRKIKK